MKITPLTAVEEQLMRLIWQMDSFYMKDIIQQHPEPKPHQNTISTYLKILTEKGYLKTTKEGRIFKYSVAIPMVDYKIFLLKELTEKFYSDNGSELLHHLISINAISKETGAEFFELKLKNKNDKKDNAQLLVEDLLKDKNKKDKKKKKKKNKD